MAIPADLYGAAERRFESGRASRRLRFRRCGTARRSWWAALEVGEIMSTPRRSLRNIAPMVNDEDSSSGSDDFVDHPLPKKKAYAKIAKKEKGQVQIHMRCSPGVISNVVGEMSNSLKKRISDLGFGSILEMNLGRLDERKLALFLVRCVKEDPLRLEVGSKVLPITPEAVNLVFGIPASGMSVPDYTPADRKILRSELRELCENKGMKDLFIRRGGNFNGLGASEVPRWVIEHYKEEDVNDWTMQSFMMLVCNALLFPTGSDKLSWFDYMMCKDLAAVPGINWCEAVCNDIKEKARDFNFKFNGKDNSAHTVQGCTAFLMVYYLDNLLCDVEVPVGTPRCKFFNGKIIENIIKFDKKLLDGGFVTYGHLNLKDPSHTVYAEVRASASHVIAQRQSADVVVPASKKGRIKSVAIRSPKAVNDVPRISASTQAPCLPAPARITRVKTYSRRRSPIITRTGKTTPVQKTDAPGASAATAAHSDDAGPSAAMGAPSAGASFC